MAKKAKTTTLKPYKTYRFSGQDPIVGKVLDIVDDVGVKQKTLSSDSGVSSSTLGNWRRKKTKRPQFATINATLMALEKELVIANIKR